MFEVNHTEQLSDEEREALEGVDEELGGEGDDTPGDDLTTDDTHVDDTPATPATPATPDPATPATPDPATPATPDPATPAETPIVEAAPPPMQLSDQLDKDLADQRTELQRKFDEGEITITEMIDQRDSLTRTQMTRDFQRNEVQRRALEVENAFFKANPDYHPSRSAIRFSVLNEQVKTLQGDPEWSKKDYPELLKEAKSRVEDAFGIKKPTPTPDATPDKRPTPPKPNADRSSVPPNLGTLPAAAGTEVSGSEFAELDALDPIALESALARMSPEKRELYLSR